MHFAASRINSIQTTLLLSAFIFLNLRNCTGQRIALAAFIQSHSAGSFYLLLGKSSEDFFLPFYFARKRIGKGKASCIKWQRRDFFNSRHSSTHENSHAIKTQWGLLLPSAILNSRTFVFIFIVEIKYKRFSRGTARLHELQASPDLLRRDRLKLRLRNHFPGLYETSIICTPSIRCRTREICRTKWPGGESLEPAHD